MKNLLIRIPIFCFALCFAFADDKSALPKVKHMIDTHIHLYDTSREKGVPWPPKEDKVLYKPHLPAEFKKASKPTGLTGVVIVEASHRLEDNQWVLDLVKDDKYFIALVGNIDPYRKDFTKQLKKLKKDSRLVGVRARNGDNQKQINYSDVKIIKSFRALAKHDLSIDILANGGGVEAVKQIDKLARTIPELRIVVDHVLGYDFDGKSANPEWVQAVEKLSENKNVWCKISGLYQRSVEQPAPHEIDHYRDVLDTLWKNLGQDRLIFGSNWPCTKNSGNYESFVQLVNKYFSEKGQEASERYFWKNAAEAYQLKLN
ncbi:MAG TPA: amidohydrolase [Verrucomicrobia bacterium]|jgi:predicted TIM-barrel fold metal-dependent hydrolase|nr:amidohydrolase [Verrucomicrobiales bacterium]HIL56091.1 amidohydrolase [Verrucomicrobiota bacterium]